MLHLGLYWVRQARLCGVLTPTDAQRLSLPLLNRTGRKEDEKVHGPRQTQGDLPPGTVTGKTDLTRGKLT